MQSGQPAKNGLGTIRLVLLACCAVFQSTCSLALLPVASRAPKSSMHKGAEVVVTMIQGSLRGELVGVEADGLVIAMESGTVNAGLIGALVGIPMGVVTAKVLGHDTDEMGAAVERGGLFLLGGMTVGAVAGILLADPLAKDETYVLKGSSKEEIEKILVQLKKRARIQNDQYPKRP